MQLYKAWGIFFMETRIREATTTAALEEKKETAQGVQAL
jgi:hypothetical protein